MNKQEPVFLSVKNRSTVEAVHCGVNRYCTYVLTQCTCGNAHIHVDASEQISSFLSALAVLASPPLFVTVLSLPAFSAAGVPLICPVSSLCFALCFVMKRVLAMCVCVCVCDDKLCAVGVWFVVYILKSLHGIV